MDVRKADKVIIRCSCAKGGFRIIRRTNKRCLWAIARLWEKPHITKTILEIDRRVLSSNSAIPINQTIKLDCCYRLGDKSIHTMLTHH